MNKKAKADKELSMIDVESYVKNLPFEACMVVYKLMVNGLDIDSAVICAKKQFNIQ
jgi:hypothetical protein